MNNKKDKKVMIKQRRFSYNKMYITNSSWL